MKEPTATDRYLQIAALALERSEELVREWLSDGRRVGDLWVADTVPGWPSFCVWVDLKTGRWMFWRRETQRS